MNNKLKNEIESKIAFVILHYGDVSVTKRCIESITKLKRSEQCIIVVVDNDVNRNLAERKSTKSILEQFTNVIVIMNEGKGGFSEANNHGYRHAKSVFNCNWIIVANNDTIFKQEDFIIRCIRCYEDSQSDKEVYVISPDIVDDRTDDHQSPLDMHLRTIKETKKTYMLNKWALKLYGLVWPVLVCWHRFVKKKHKLFVTKRCENIVPMGACIVFTPAYVRKEKVAFWPETMFFYEEYLLALRCKEKEYLIIYEPSINVIHQKSTATQHRFIIDKNVVEFMLRQTAQSSLVYLRCLTSLQAKVNNDK